MSSFEYKIIYLYNRIRSGRGIPACFSVHSEGWLCSVTGEVAAALGYSLEFLKNNLQIHWTEFCLKFFI